MQPERIEVHLACNDDRGNFAGELYEVQFHEPGGDVLLTLDFDPLDGLSFEWLGDQLRFETDAHVWWFTASGHARWVGNICWDATSMERTAALDFARYLIRRGFFVSQHVCEAPWDSVRDAEHG